MVIDVPHPLAYLKSTHLFLCLPICAFDNSILVSFWLHAITYKVKPILACFFSVPDISVVRDLIGRERELRASRIVNRILMSCTDCCHSNSSGFNVVSYAGRLSIPQADVNQSHEDLDETEHW